ncbi:MAG: hypothetical protein F2814_05830, partial [Actinobacteria bacterium]|nr:hypothetical protein [Actinomycetota bacterium]
MRKISVLVVLLFIAILTPVAPASASTPKAGGICAKSGVSKVVAGKKFTCMKAGKKFAWSKGVATTVKTPPASSILVPHPVEGGYGITWDNVLSKINDISAAAWTDAQATIARNKNLPS